MYISGEKRQLNHVSKRHFEIHRGWRYFKERRSILPKVWKLQKRFQLSIYINCNIYFCFKPLLDILMSVFSICLLEWTEESDNEGFASESTHSFLKIRRNSFKNPTTLLRRYNPNAVDTEISAWEDFPLVSLIFYRFCNVVFYL